MNTHTPDAKRACRPDPMQERVNRILRECRVRRPALSVVFLGDDGHWYEHTGADVRRLTTDSD